MSGRAWTSKGRQFERSRRCQNCIHFESGELSKKLWKDKLAAANAEFDAERLDLESQRVGELTRRLNDPTPISDEEIKPVARTLFDAKPLYRAMDKAISEGAAGICLKGKTQTDFVDFRYLCADGGNGRDGASLVTHGQPLDKSNDEIKDILDVPSKKDGEQ